MLVATLRGTAAVALAAALAACTPQQNANVLPGNQALTASTVAFGTVVLITSCSISEFIMLRSMARRCSLVRLSLRRPCP